MFDHFEIKTVRFVESVKFYASVLEPLGIELKWSDESAAGFGLADESNVRFLIEESSHAQNCHIAFTASDTSSVDAFHSIGTSMGFTDNGPPGLREEYAPNYYAAFLLDPDGNNIEALIYI
ncbi:glyoxalase/Bleomycin resistance protein/dioxygenase superfamily [Rubidibacter lacunae KORDI 51-2]|uniref:Glyoxalase/Bleomycin resistance protein/dioxygenase superfamily n=1 Tax=Rubidibacter lacunae KORDI 51-2 TaxID=582515 RepID=U5DDQ1_9CHRO|nr:VOC family protein [Rubidibacter lacunae]ERN42638.1 glyoxalase/Bleomycin resistance protein/dioxygenase superfamily [Rubidibacter lacunae KORDI 51-2]